MSPLSESNSPAKVTAPQKQPRSFLPKLFGRKNSKTELIAKEAVVTKENAEAPPAVTPTFFAVVHTFKEGKAEEFFNTMGAMTPDDFAAMAEKHHGMGFHNHSFMPTSTDKVLCVWEAKKDTSADDFQAFIDGVDGPAPGVFDNSVNKVMPGAMTPTSFFGAESAAAPAPAPSTGTFFWVHHSFKEGAAPAFWEMMGGMGPADFTAMTAGFNALGFHNHSFMPVAMDGPHAAICIWESKAPMSTAEFQTFIDGPNGPGAGATFTNEVYEAAPGASLPSAHFTAVDMAKQMAERFNPGFQYVKLEFEVLADKLEEFKAALRDRPDGIPFTVQQKGFKLFLPCIHNEKNEAGNYTVTFMGMWKSCDDWKAYMATPERAVDSEFMKVAFPTLGPKGLTPTFTDALDLGPEAHVFAEAAGEQFEYVKLEFEVLADKLEAFQEGLKGPDGIPFTAKQPGFKAFFPCVHHEKNEAGNYTVTFFAMWRTAAEQQAYMSTPQRAPDSAFMAALFPCLGPKGLDIVYATPLDLGTPHAFYTSPTETFIRSWLAEYALVAKASDGEAFDAMWAKYWAPDAVVIRPSGNPMDKATWKAMITSDDVSFASSECLSIDSTTLFAGGKAACVTFTTHDKFTYKGTPNDDIAKYSATLELTEEGSWKMIHAHRSTGQSPS